jgi:O-antigen ligase
MTTRFNRNFITYLIIAGVSSFLLSLFLLQLFLGILSICWLLESFENKKKALDIFTYFILVFGLIRILSIIFSQYPSVSVQSFYKDALFYFSFFSLTFYLKALDKSKVEKISYSFIISAVFIAVIGLVLFNLSLVDRAASFSSGYATFSSYLITALGVHLFMPYKIKVKHNWLLWPLGISLILAAVITSLGRTNIIIAVLLITASLFFKRINILPLVSIIILTTLLCLFSFHNNNIEASRRVEDPTALSDRNILMEGAKAIALEHPIIGFGPRTFKNIFPFHDRISDKLIGSWHNDFIQIYFESGAAGLLSFLSIIIAPLYFNYKYLKDKTQDLFYNNLARGILFGIIALVLSAVTAGFIDSPVLSIVFAFLISLLSSLIYHKNHLASS